jgi:hypothetical protein
LGGVARAREWREVRDSVPGMKAPQERVRRELPGGLQGRAGRSLALLCALCVGLILAVVLIPHFGAWTHHIGDLGGGDH